MELGEVVVYQPDDVRECLLFVCMPEYTAEELARILKQHYVAKRFGLTYGGIAIKRIANEAGVEWVD